MEIPFYQLDAFSDAPFGGNPAAVCPLDAWLPAETLQAIAAENNLSETAFFVKAAKDADFDYELRWFTPLVEVDLCGHATLAAGSVILSHYRKRKKKILFQSQSGLLSVARDGERFTMDFPGRKPEAVEAPKGLAQAMGKAPAKVLKGERDFLLIYPEQSDVLELEPDFPDLSHLGLYGYIASAPGEDCDFISRCFFPAYGIDEDPVTGSAHCVSGPYWSDGLGIKTLKARQLSERGGTLWLTVDGDRIHISGHCVEVIAGVLTV